MSNQKILIIGDGNHQFIINLVIWLKKEMGDAVKVDILSLTTFKEENRKYYNSVYTISESKLINQIKGIRTTYRFHQYKRLFNRLPEYDIVNFHYITLDSYFWTSLFAKRTKSKIILSIWGSDLYRLKKINENNFINACSKADEISFTNETSLIFFKDKYQWKKNNLHTIRFGLAPLEILKGIKENKLQSKHKLHWNENKLAIVIGYNLSPQQQHLEILKALNSQKLIELKNKIQLIIPITYGGSIKYKNQLIEQLELCQFEYLIYDSFLSDNDVAYIRKAADIMIQLQTTDQFSGSMQEHLFAKNVVITGSWLPYNTMKNEGAWFIEIDRVEALTETLYQTIENYEDLKLKTVNNSDAIERLSSWNENIKYWVALYNS